MALYDSIGRTYADYRRPEPRIAAAINRALGDAASVINVGAGTGSYEPPGKTSLAVEPSERMIAQRPADAAPCVIGTAEALPVDSASVDAAMAILSVHHWTDPEAGLREMGRVARKRVVLLTWVPDSGSFWLTRDYFPEIMAHDRTIFPDSETLGAMLTRLIGPTVITPLPIPHDCTDGFLCAYWRRPEAYLDEGTRSGISSFARFDPSAGLDELADDLASGRWTARNAGLMTLDSLDAGYRVAVCEIAGGEGAAHA